LDFSSLLLGGTHIYFLTYTSWYNNNIMSEIYRHNSPVGLAGFSCAGVFFDRSEGGMCA
jgi:hypothetical protein